ncbi:MAG TPA: hypothetical protein VGM90_27200 [Kofleriaceae bacterium]|jgi:hypothetical protein
MLRLGDRALAVVSATLELFHLYAEEAGWVLRVECGGERLALEGRVRTPALPGPSSLVAWYVDAPRVYTIDGSHGTLSADEKPALDCVARGAGLAKISGVIKLAWAPISGGDSRPVSLEIALDAALIT